MKPVTISTLMRTQWVDYVAQDDNLTSVLFKVTEYIWDKKKTKTLSSFFGVSFIIATVSAGKAYEYTT